MRKKIVYHAVEDRLYDQKHREGFLSLFLQNEMIRILHCQGLRRQLDGSRTNGWHLLLHLLINLLCDRLRHRRRHHRRRRRHSKSNGCRRLRSSVLHTLAH